MEEEKKQTSDEELKALLANVLVRQGEYEGFDDNDEIEIDWIGILAKLLKGWKLIAFGTIIFAAIGVGVALIQEQTFTAKVTLAPEPTSSGGSGGSSLSGIASMFGISTGSAGGGAGAISVSMIPEISVSTPFLVDLFSIPVTPYVSKEELKKGAKPASPVALYDYLTPKKKKSWLSSIFPEKEEEPEDTILDINRLTMKQSGVVGLLTKAITADVDKKTNMITVEVTMDDPEIATQLADTVCQRLQDYIIAYRTKKVKEDLDYYTKLSDEAKEKLIKAQSNYANSVDFDRSVILQSVSNVKERLQAEAQLAQQIYQQMETQKEAAKAKYQEMKPVFTVIQPATFPLFPNEKRKITVLIFFALGFVLSAAWVAVGRDFLTKMKDGIKTAKNKEKE